MNPFPVGDSGFWLIVADPPRWLAVTLAWFRLVGPVALTTAALVGIAVWALLGWRWLQDPGDDSNGR